MSNSHEQSSEPNRDHEGNLNSPSHFFIDFADNVMGCAPTARTIAEDFHELPAYAKANVLKKLVYEIMENLLKGLPEVEKEEFLNDCFKALYEKLPWKSQVSVGDQVKRSTTMMTPDTSDTSSSGSGQGQGRPLPPPPPPLPKFIVDTPATIGSGSGQGEVKK